MLGDEVRNGRKYFVPIRAGASNGGDLVAHVARPALGSVEGEDTDGGRILAQHIAAGVGHVGLGQGQAAERAAEIIEHEIDISTEGAPGIIEGESRKRTSLQDAPKIAAVQSDCESYR